MLIGLDFDNTIVCYDRAIVQLTDKLSGLPSELRRIKPVIRDFFRQNNREPEWTAFQGVLYGPGMAYAEPFEQALETIKMLKDKGHSLCIVSHRSLQPYVGPAYDLHEWARDWIEKRLANRGLIENEQVYFHETREQKISAIKSLGCKAFLDDLPEVLEDERFPSACQAILFDPTGIHLQKKLQRITHWRDLPKLLGSFK